MLSGKQVVYTCTLFVRRSLPWRNEEIMRYCLEHGIFIIFMFCNVLFLMFVQFGIEWVVYIDENSPTIIEISSWKTFIYLILKHLSNRQKC